MGFKTFTSAVLTSSDVNTYLMQQAVITCTSSTRPSSPVEGMHIYETDTDLVYIYNGSAWVQVLALGAWTSWTPAVTQSSSVTVTNDRSRYSRQARRIFGQFSLTVTGSGTTGNDITVTIPVTAGATSGVQVGNGFVFDNSGSIRYHGALELATNGTFTFASPDLAGSVGTTPAFGLAVNDKLLGYFDYEAAASS